VREDEAAMAVAVVFETESNGFKGNQVVVVATAAAEVKGL